ncbi:MAG: hypothetical protein Q9192_006157 [Flavoplaca navasiana]
MLAEGITGAQMVVYNGKEFRYAVFVEGMPEAAGFGWMKRTGPSLRIGGVAPSNVMDGTWPTDLAETLEEVAKVKIEASRVNVTAFREPYVRHEAGMTTTWEYYAFHGPIDAAACQNAWLALNNDVLRKRQLGQLDVPINRQSVHWPVRSKNGWVDLVVNPEAGMTWRMLGEGVVGGAVLYLGRHQISHNSTQPTQVLKEARNLREGPSFGLTYLKELLNYLKRTSKSSIRSKDGVSKYIQFCSVYAHRRKVGGQRTRERVFDATYHIMHRSAIPQLLRAVSATMARDRDKPSLKSKPPTAPTNEKDESYKNCLTLVPITHPSDAQKPGLRGQYRIPPELYDSLSRFLNPNLKWGFVMCCVGGQAGLQVEKRLTSVEKYLDDFVVESQDGEDIEVRGNTGGLGGTKKRFKHGVRVAVEIHPPGRHETPRSTGDADDGLGSYSGVKIRPQVKENNKRRKSSAGEDNASKPRDVIRAVDDRSDPEVTVGTMKDSKRRRLYDSDQAQLERQLGQSYSADPS